MNIFKIQTTEYGQEDFFLYTELEEQDIVEVINPIVMAERDGYEIYDNESILNALEKRFPRKKIELHVEFPTITF
jgi:hypothetical protein